MSDPVTTADVVLTVRVSGIGPWSDEETIANIREIACQQAIGRINKVIANGRDVTIVGKPYVEVITRIPRGDSA